MATSPALPEAFLNAWHESLAGLKCLSQTLALSDLAGDNDYRLLAADQEQKLRVYRGTGLSSTHALLGEPVGVAAFYPDSAIPRTPSIAIAAGNSVYVYRALRPYLKFSLPALSVSAGEVAVWAALRARAQATGGTVPPADVDDAVRELGAMRDAGERLSSRALDAIAIAPGAERCASVESSLARPLVQHTVVTAMATIAREREGEGEMSTLLLGTEAAHLLVLNAAGSEVATTVALPSVPVSIVTHGALISDHRIYVSARNGSIYAVKNGALLPIRIEPAALPVGIVRTATELVVACADASLVGYAPKGDKPLWTKKLPATVTAVTRMLVRRDRGADCVVVALTGGDVHVYASSALVASFTVPETVVGAVYGQYGREANTLVLVLRSGALLLKMLRRTADLAAPAPRATGAAPPEQDVPLPIPKKTRLALEQGMRERDCAVDMHRGFQKGLLKLRLATAKEYLNVLLKTGGPAAAAAAHRSTVDALGSSKGGAASAPLAAAAPATLLRVACEALGLGPSFSLRVTITNTGETPVADIGVIFEAEKTPAGDVAYVLPVSLRTVPPLLAGDSALIDVAAEGVRQTGTAGDINVYVVQLPPSSVDSTKQHAARASSRPLLSFVIHLPEYE